MISLFMNLSSNAVTVIIRILEVIIGLLTLITMKIKLSGPIKRSGKSSRAFEMGDLLTRLEERDRTIERLRIENHAHKLRHTHIKQHHFVGTCKKSPKCAIV